MLSVSILSRCSRSSTRQTCARLAVPRIRRRENSSNRQGGSRRPRRFGPSSLGRGGAVSDAWDDLERLARAATLDWEYNGNGYSVFPSWDEPHRITCIDPVGYAAAHGNLEYAFAARPPVVLQLIQDLRA